MATHRRTWFDADGVVIGDQRVPFYSGALHYWRVDPKAWAPALATLRAQGLTCVESYVPWRVHEPTAGRFEWSGAADLPRFVTLARDAGLAVALRPGPAVNAELTSFGLPDHVLRDEESQAITARGTPVWLPSPPGAWPVPSYASTAFHAHVARWYRAFADAIGEHLAPAGPIVALGVDNEARMFFRLGAFDHDYHPDALTWFRDEGHGEAPKAWHPDDAARCAAWVRFKERYLARALTKFSTLMDDAGLDGIARFHNLPAGELHHCDARGMSAAIDGPVGLDAYTRRPRFPMLRRATAALGERPFAFEVGVGYAPWFLPLSARGDTTRERDQLLRLLAGGVRGFNLFMAVERERFYGAAVDAHGELEPHAAWIQPLIAALDATDWPTLRREPRIALVATRADERFGLATCVLDPITPLAAEALGLGPGGAAELGTDAGAIAARRWHEAVATALEHAGVAYAIVDEGSTAAELSKFAAVVVPTQDRVDRGLWTQLAAATCTIVLGPTKPTRDELDQPLEIAGPKRTGRLQADVLENAESLSALAADLAGLAGVDDAAPWTLVGRNAATHVSAFRDATGRVRAAFVTSDAAKSMRVRLRVEGRVRDPFAKDPVVATGAHVDLDLGPYGVRFLVVD